MDKKWDSSGIAFNPVFWSEMYRVLKPGAYILAFGGTRTHHRLMVAIEDAGFEVRDCLQWLYATGFPKSKATLKPSWEPIILARKPARKGKLLNIDQCRLSLPVASPPVPSSLGRWPSNVIVDEHAADLLVKKSGFYFCPKASKKEKNAGLDSFALSPSYMVANGSKTAGSRDKRHDRTTMHQNPHPCVKPLQLTKWLATLIKPEGDEGRLLVPFAGEWQRDDRWVTGWVGRDE